MSDLEDFRADKDGFFRDDPRSPPTDEQRASFDGLSYFPETPELVVQGRLPDPGRRELARGADPSR
jgi:hypothetical protein